MICKNCGGECKSIGNGQYKCSFCGAICEMGSSLKKQETNEIPINNAKPIVAMQNNDGVDVFDNSINGVLEISCAGKQKQWVGSGFLVTDDGYAMTNAHVAADEDGRPVGRMMVKVCNQIVPARVVSLADDRAGHGSGVDLAIIKLDNMPSGAKALQFEDFDKVRNGEQVYVIGNSLGDGSCITSGIVSDKSRQLGGKTLLMTDCAINGGNSGGPIFNSKGRVIGVICSSRIKPDGTETKGMNYAVPADITIEFLDKTINF